MSVDDLLQLQEPLKDGGIRSVNFFNGRLLSGKDLSREQAARREANARLGMAIGEGVAFGLEVARDPDHDKPASPVLSVQAGLAVNRLGQTLRLVSKRSVALVRRFDAPAAGCVFANCTPIAGGTYVAGAGVYLLTIAPAELTEGRAPSNGLDPSNVACNTDALVEGVQFRLLPVNPLKYAGLDLASPQFRNRLAYLCFAVGARLQDAVDPWRVDAAPKGLVDQLRTVGLDDRDVPLALVYWKADGIQFVDQWAVRRGLSRPADNGLFGCLAGDSRLIEGQAMLLQFQAHIASLGNPGGNLGSVTARSHFRYLPAAGVIPVLEESGNTDAQATRFFKDMTYSGPAFINGARLEPLLRDSWRYPAIDAQGAELVWLYRVRENRMAIDGSTGSGRPRSYVVFASGHMPYQADAQFDLAYWNYSNYALNR